MIDIFNTPKYKDPPNYSNYKSYKKYIIRNCTCKCVYCSIKEVESPAATFEIDHFKPKSIFEKYENDIFNLRLACRSCNLYKSNSWISKSDGCNRDCDCCTNKICQKNIERFYDSMNEDISSIMAMDKNYFLYPINESKVSKYTIEKLRLNRKALVNLRKNREELRLLNDKITLLIKYYDEQLRINRERYECVASKKTDFIDNKQEKKFELFLSLLSLTETYLNSFHHNIICIRKEIENLLN